MLEKLLAGAKLKKEQGYADMMAHVNQKCACKWTSAQTQTRFKSMLSTYKRVRIKFYDTTGAKYCLTPEEYQAGLTIQSKVDKECFGFFRLETLFAGRQNITPSYTEEPNQEEEEESAFIFQHEDIEESNDECDGSQVDGSQFETQALFDELLMESQSSSHSSSSSASADTPVPSAAATDSAVEHSGQTSAGSLTVTSKSTAPSKRKSKTGTDIPAELAAAEETEKVKKVKKG